MQNTSFRQSVCLLLKKGGYPENVHILGVGVESYCLHNVSTLTDIFIQIYVSFHYTFFFPPRVVLLSFGFLGGFFVFKFWKFASGLPLPCVCGGVH